MRSSTLSKILGILAVAILVGGLIGWLASRNPSKTESTPPLPVSEGTTTTTTTELTQPPVEETTNTEVKPTSDVASTNAFDPALWEERLDEILGDADDDTDRKSRQLLEMMPKVGEQAQVEIAGHLVNLVNDDDFARSAAKFLTNSDVPESVSSIFMNDLYNREANMKLPLLLAVARNEKHALRDEAKDLLELYVEEDYGTNWNQWEESMNKYIKEHGGE